MGRHDETNKGQQAEERLVDSTEGQDDDTAGYLKTYRTEQGGQSDPNEARR